MKKPARRVRRSPYGRALEMATKRYDKAVAEYLKCQSRLSALEEEIPRLDEMKRVLEGYMKGGKAGSAPPPRTLSSPAPDVNLPPAANYEAPVNLPPSIADRVPEHLRRFIPIHPSTLRNSQAQGAVVRTNLPGNDDDSFLPDPVGTEILP